MLELKNIVKVYGEGDSAVTALKGINLSFRKSEFVAILGPSGCGKTTMLNIVGGLDRYTSGDLLVDGKSTELFKPYEWDAYRNNCVGFVFQNYNLIMHQTILENVELALALSGVSAKERKERALEALKEVGLEKHVNKKPNQLSGGQMQRVAIARAIVNNPEIILADEPTGALDSKNSVQIVELLQEIAKNRLVVMVTHNDSLAEDYATRIIKMLDGEIIDDSKPYTPAPEDYPPEEEILPVPNVDGLSAKDAEKVMAKYQKQLKKAKKAKLKKTSMSVGTSFRLSIKNLFTKKGRTFMTAFAGSIGIVGVALVLAVSNGFNTYIDNMQKSVLGQYPISIMQQHFDMANAMGTMAAPINTGDKGERFPDGDKISVSQGIAKTYQDIQVLHYNKIDEQYMDYVSKMPAEYYSEITYDYALRMHLVTKDSGSTTGYSQIEYMDTSNNPFSMIMGQSSKFNQMVNTQYMQENYEVLAGDYPTEWNQVVMVVNPYNQVSQDVLDAFKFDGVDRQNITFDKIIGQTFRLIGEDDWYGERVDNKYNPNTIDKTMYEKGEEIKVVGIMRLREDADMSLFNTGLVYLPSLAEHVINNNIHSNFGKEQLEEVEKYNNNEKEGYNLVTGTHINDLNFMEGLINASLEPAIFGKIDKGEITLQQLGLSTLPTNIYIYPKSFESKESIKTYLDNYNVQHNLVNKDGKITPSALIYNDPSEIMTETMMQLVKIVSIVLVCFASISLVVSSIMIGIITYVSVVERTKEIGILRSIGARKRDIGNVFNAETSIIGLSSGLLGVILAYILTIPINFIARAVAHGVLDGINIAILHPLAALVLVVISVALTFLAGLIPAKLAADKDPVKSLRAE